MDACLMPCDNAFSFGRTTTGAHTDTYASVDTHTESGSPTPHTHTRTHARSQT